MPIKEHKTKAATVRLLHPNIVENIINNNTTVEYDDVMEMKAVNKKFTAGETLCCFS